MDGVNDPVDTWIIADGLVLRVNQNDFEVFVGGILVDPVRIEHTEIGATSADALFSSGSKRALVLELIHTLVGRFAL